MSAGARKKRQSMGQSIGGVLFGFEQQILRNQPPPEELVYQARPDAPVPAGDGSFVTLEMPPGPTPGDASSDDDDTEDLASPGDTAAGRPPA